MALPKQVEKQLKEVEALEKSLNAQPEPKEDAALEPEAKQPEVAPQPEVKPNQPEPQKTVDWEQKYRTLQGMFDAEVPKLHASNRELNSKLNEALEQINALKTAAPAAPKAAESLVTDKDVETFGGDLIDLQRRVASEVSANIERQFQGKLDKLEAENRALKEQVQSTGNQVGELTFEQRLSSAVPDFAAVNRDPRWIEWLAEVDPMTRGPRRNLAQDAYAKGDVDGVAHYVKLFRDTLAPAPKQNDKKSELERQVAPSRTNSTVPSTPQAKVYSNAQIEQLWAEVRQKSIRGRIDEANQLEAEITAAYMEGRVRA